MIALIREGQDRAFEALVDRYQTRLHAFCRGMLGSNEDAEDILQEVFVAAHKAMLADSRPINARPWLYRIARNRCLNHLRKPVAEGQDSMDVLPGENGTSVAERVQGREDFRALIADVGDLAETQKTALLLREIDDLSYEEIALAMETTIPAVKSLLVRARMSLADATHGRKLTCDEVHLTLAEAAEGLRKASGAERAHIKRCEPCREYRNQLRSNNRALAAMAPIGLLATLQHFFSAKLGLGGAKLGGGAASGTAAGGASAGSAGTAAGGAAAAGGSGGAFSLAGGAAGVIGTKAVAGMASVAILTAGAVEAKHFYGEQTSKAPAVAQVDPQPKPATSSAASPGHTRHFTGGTAAPAAADRTDSASSSPAKVSGSASNPAAPVPKPDSTKAAAAEIADPTPATNADAPDAATGPTAEGGGAVLTNGDGSEVGGAGPGATGESTPSDGSSNPDGSTTPGLPETQATTPPVVADPEPAPTPPGTGTASPPLAQSQVQGTQAPQLTEPGAPAGAAG